jgi:hypothetical protein
VERKPTEIPSSFGTPNFNAALTFRSRRAGADAKKSIHTDLAQVARDIPSNQTNWFCLVGIPEESEEGIEVDNILIAVYWQLVLRTRASAEDILEDPELRNTFLSEVRSSLGEHLPERQLLHRLSYLRKQRRLPRSRDIVAA